MIQKKSVLLISFLCIAFALPPLASASTVIQARLTHAQRVMRIQTRLMHLRYRESVLQAHGKTGRMAAAGMAKVERKISRLQERLSHVESK
ncbi:hypothetical protein JKG47_11780 [Acidithiobacillus sp. MC6.1]|nr:hypothetical protein [Acidithiobacillus sp. MC6.1]